MNPFYEIEVKKNGVWKKLNLGRNPRWGFNAQNPMFRKDSIPGFSSFPVSIPYAENAKCLGYPNVFSSQYKLSEIEARVKLYGGTWCCGKLKIQKANCNRIKVKFQDNQGEFKELLKDKNLRDMCEEQHEIPCGTLVCYTYELGDYIYNELPNGNFILNFTINGTTYTLTYNGSSLNSAPVTALEILQDLAQLVNADPNSPVTIITTTPGNSNTNAQITFCSESGLVISAILPTLYWTLIDTTITSNSGDDCWKDYLNNWMSQTGKLSHVFPPISAPNLFEGDNPNWNGVLNYYIGGTYPANNSNPSLPKYAFAPQISLSWLLSCIEEYTGFEFKGYILEDDCFCKIHLKSNYLIDTQTLSYNLSDHIPNITALDLLNAIQKMGITLKFDKFDKCVTFTLIKESLKRPTKKLNKDIVCSEGDVCHEDENGFELSFPKPEGDELKYKTDDTFNSVTLGNGGQKIEMCYTPLSDYEGPWTIGDWIIPCFDGKASTDLLGIGENDCGIRFFFYHGFQPSLGATGLPSVTYPMGSSCEYNILNEQLCEWNLKLEGENGIYETFYKDWLEVANNPRVEVTILPDTKFVANYDECEPIELEVDGITNCFLIEKWRMNVDDCKFLKGKATLLPIY